MTSIPRPLAGQPALRTPSSSISRIAAAGTLGTAGLGLALALGGCSSVSDALSPTRVDYKAASVRNSPLEIPPDLSQLGKDARYQPTAGQVVSANALQQPASGPALASSRPVAAPIAASVALVASGGARIERAGSQRWLVIDQTPEALWPRLRNFWIANGLEITQDNAPLGTMETGWIENRAKLPRDGIRRFVGAAADALYDSGQRDRYRLRVERSATSNGSEIFLSHRSAVQVVIGPQKDRVEWEPAPADPQIEAEMLARLMLYLAPAATAAATNTPEGAAALGAATAAVEKAPSAPARARLLDGRPAASLQVDDDFARAWRRVGAALDRNGFTVEDRDRGQGLYFVRYVDPKLAGKDEPGFFARVFGGAKKEDLGGTRYRVGIKAEGKASVVAIFDNQGAPQNSESARNIIGLLLNELR